MFCCKNVLLYVCPQQQSGYLTWKKASSFLKNALFFVLSSKKRKDRQDAEKSSKTQRKQKCKIAKTVEILLF